MNRATNKLAAAGAIGVLLTLMAPVVTLSAAEQPNLRFQHLSVEEGLSQASVNTVLQDRNGFMWFGTQEGLNRYDGYRFTTFAFNPADPTSLANDSVKDILEDRSGVLWVGTEGVASVGSTRQAGHSPTSRMIRPTPIA